MFLLDCELLHNKKQGIQFCKKSVEEAIPISICILYANFKSFSDESVGLEISFLDESGENLAEPRYDFENDE